MIQRMLTSALLAGFAAGLLAALLHFAFVQNLILLSEQYETGALVHFGAASAHDHADHAVAPEVAIVPDATPNQVDHSHDHADGEVGSLQRNALTSLFFGLAYVAYGLVLVAGFGLAEVYGKQVTRHQGLLWGIAGFAAVQLAPAMGLEPELPGTMAADLAARQIWWLGTAVSTGLGLALLGYGRGLLMAGLAVLLLAAPHVIGAPELDGFTGVAPPELASSFAARSLGVGLIVWASLGALAGQLWASPHRS